MTAKKSAAIGAAIGLLVGMAMLAALPSFYLPGEIEVLYRQTAFKAYGKNRGIGTFKNVDKAVDLHGVCRVETMRVKCTVDLGGPQI